MTAQSRPAGWYPDPTGQGGQKYWDGDEWEQELAPIPEPGHAALPDHAPQSSAGDAHPYKNPVLCGIGGLVLPPLALFLIGGSRTTCASMVGLWVVFWITVWMMGIGAVFAIAIYIWSVVACYQEAVKQNEAHGLAS